MMTNAEWEVHKRLLDYCLAYILPGLVPVRGSGKPSVEIRKIIHYAKFNKIMSQLRTRI